MPEEVPLPAVATKPDYGLCRIPFGPLRGQLFMDTAPYDLRRLREWCLSRPDGAAEFAGLVHDIEIFLSL